MIYKFHWLLFWLVTCCFTGYAQTTSSGYTDLPVASFKMALSKEKNKTLLDVRTPEEYQQGHISGAININFYDPDFKDKIKQLPSGKPIYIYCAVGGRSAKAARLLTDSTPNISLYNLAGGFTAWQKAHFPVQK